MRRTGAAVVRRLYLDFPINLCFIWTLTFLTRTGSTEKEISPIIPSCTVHLRFFKKCTYYRNNKFYGSV
jgi:hypothetical protein